MQNLEKRIAEWRRTMTKASGYPDELVEELEGHLRDEVDRLLRSGTPQDVAFDIARSKLGEPSALATEFDKLTPGGPTHSMPRRIARIFISGAALMLSAFLIPRIVSGRTGILLASHVLCITLGYLMMFSIGGLCIWSISSQLFRSPGPSERRALLRSVLQFANIAGILTAIGVILGMLWAKDHLGRYWAWDLKETGGFLVISWALVMSAIRWLRRMQPGVASLGIVGSVITTWAWFGTRGPDQSILSNSSLCVILGVQLLFLLVPLATTTFARAPEA